MPEPSDITIRGDAIRLGQFLKLADAVDQGSDVKLLLGSEAVLVNGEVETRRGRQLRGGDIVEVSPSAFRVTTDEDPQTRTDGDSHAHSHEDSHARADEDSQVHTREEP